MRRNARGQATVELALFGIVLVPTILYTLFLHDMMRYKLDLIEAVTTAPWDYTTLNYESSIDEGGPAKWNRHSWCDHTTAYNSYDKAKECDDMNHHEALSAHACWLVQGAQQVKCDRREPDAAMDPYQGDLPKGVNKGGRFYCSAKLGVINYFLPQKIFTSFTEQQTTTKKEMHGQSENVHQFGKASTAEDEWVLSKQSFGLITDTWAMTTVEDVSNNSNSGGVLYKRVEMGWKSGNGKSAKDLGKGLIDDEILNKAANTDTGHTMMIGDDPTTIQVGWTKAAPPDVQGNFASPWQDWDGDKVEATYNARGGHYMGATEAPE